MSFLKRNGFHTVFWSDKELRVTMMKKSEEERSNRLQVFCKEYCVREEETNAWFMSNISDEIVDVRASRHLWIWTINSTPIWALFSEFFKAIEIVIREHSLILGGERGGESLKGNGHLNIFWLVGRVKVIIWGVFAEGHLENINSEFWGRVNLKYFVYIHFAHFLFRLILIKVRKNDCFNELL